MSSCQILKDKVLFSQSLYVFYIVLSSLLLFDIIVVIGGGCGGGGREGEGLN